MATNEETNAAGTDTRPPMLVEEITIHGKFAYKENKLEMADTQAEIILSQGLPRHIFNILNQTSTAQEIWNNVELLMQGSGRTLQQRKEDLFDEYNRFSLPLETTYWGKYVTNVKQNMDISTTPYVQIYTHLKAYEPHAKKTLKKQEQSTSIVDPLAYVAHTTSAPALSSPSTPSPQPTAQSPNDALMATMTQIANLLSGFQKQFPPTNNQLRTSSNSRTHATVHDGQIVTEPVQRKAQKGDVLDAEAEAFLADVQCIRTLRSTTGLRLLTDSGSVDPAQALNVPIVPLGAMLTAVYSLTSRPPYSLAWLNHMISTQDIMDPDLLKKLVLKNFCTIPAKLLLQLASAFKERGLSDRSGTFFYQEHIHKINVPILVVASDQDAICPLKLYKNLTIEKKNLLIRNDCLIAECLEKDICSIVLTSDIVVPPSSNCLCEDLRSACDREHTKVLELEAEISKQKQLITESEKRFAFLEQNYVCLQLKFQNYKQCIDTSSASNAIFEINKLRQQLQGKDDTIRNLDAQINIMKVLNVGSTEGSCDQQALETDRIQLKDTITSLRIQLDGLKVENVSLKRRYDELSKANNHSRIAYTEKLSAFTAENTKLKAQVTGTTSSGPSTSEKPKVLASGMYTNSSKYIPPPKRANWVKPTPLPKKKQVTFQEPPRTSNRPTQKQNLPLNLANLCQSATLGTIVSCPIKV
ncbi:hypothetical protein Tco_0046620 [Tanacetum coccineum]